MVGAGEEVVYPVGGGHPSGQEGRPRRGTHRGGTVEGVETGSFLCEFRQLRHV